MPPYYRHYCCMPFVGHVTISLPVLYCCIFLVPSFIFCIPNFILSQSHFVSKVPYPIFQFSALGLESFFCYGSTLDFHPIVLQLEGGSRLKHVPLCFHLDNYGFKFLAFSSESYIFLFELLLIFDIWWRCFVIVAKVMVLNSRYTGREWNRCRK